MGFEEDTVLRVDDGREQEWSVEPWPVAEHGQVSPYVILTEFPRAEIQSVAPGKDKEQDFTVLMWSMKRGV
jgi:hypothetical protein